MCAAESAEVALLQSWRGTSRLGLWVEGAGCVIGVEGCGCRRRLREGDVVYATDGLVRLVWVESEGCGLVV